MAPNVGLSVDLSGPVEAVAVRLLGCRLATDFGGPTVVRLTEVEAYGGETDPASHASRGPTARNASMFGPPGTLYVYLSYGIHWCMNIATGNRGLGGAVLLRGGEIVEGEDVVVTRRGRSDHLTDGPGKLTQALGVSGEQDGTDVLEGPVRLLPGGPDPPSWVSTPRIGISKATEREWRFVVNDGRRAEPRASSPAPGAVGAGD